MTQINDDNVPENTDGTNDVPALDYEVQSYQDEIDTDPGKTDPVMSEMNDDPVEELGVPASKLAEELDKRDLGDPNTTDDMREAIEDIDQDEGDETKY